MTDLATLTTRVHEAEDAFAELGATLTSDDQKKLHRRLGRRLHIVHTAAEEATGMVVALRSGGTDKGDDGDDGGDGGDEN